jgi:hypothetical protein
MSDAARDYVRDLGPDRITARRKQLLYAIAGHYSDRYKSANVPLDELGDEILADRRSLTRLIAQEVDSGELEYFPGRGRGNFSRFNLPRFEKEREKVAGRWSRGGYSDARNKEENLNLFQNLKPPQTPPSAKEGLSDRDRRRLATRISDWQERCRLASTQGSRWDDTWSDVIAEISADLCLPLDLVMGDLARDEIWRDRLGMKRPPERAIV